MLFSVCELYKHDTDYLDNQIHLLAKFKVVPVYVWRSNAASRDGSARVSTQKVTP